MRKLAWFVVCGVLACTQGPGETREEGPAAASPPTFSPPAGTYGTAQSVTVASATAGAVVRCTIDGSAPTAATSPCADPLVVASTATVRAIATASGLAPSAIAAAAYTIDLGAPQAAAPTFTPPGGTYTAAQSVTVASATAGAVVRCTTDGSTPTAATPACASPLAVTSTATVRAIATAPGHAPSDVSAATYAIAPATTAEKLAAFATKRTWFAHQSVGDNVYHGPASNDAAGLGALAAAHPAAGTAMQELYPGSHAQLAAIPAGRWADSLAGAPNGDPVGKLNAFATSLGADFGGGLDHAGLKFCFSDVDVSIAHSDSVWVTYQAVMDPIEAAYPGRLIHFTVPLTTYELANEYRERLSNHIRTKYESTGRVFDIADLESRDANGNLVLGANGHRTLNAAWDDTDHSHLDAAGANWVAAAYLEFMYGVELRGRAAATAATGARAARE